jgi:hypothetical protein
MSKLTFDNIAVLLEANAETDAIFAFGELADERGLTTFELSVFVRSFYKYGGAHKFSDLVLNLDIVEEYLEKENRGFYEFVSELDKLALTCIAAEEEVNSQLSWAQYKYYCDSDAY